MLSELTAWAERNGVPPRAMAELAQLLADPPAPSLHNDDRSEAATQSEVKLEGANWGGVLWRNNVGVFVDDTGVPVRYGLANDSRRLNQKVKSSDLIGALPLVVGPQHVGRTLGIFVAVECKRGAWRWTGTDREQGQRRYHHIVQSVGGVAGFACGRNDFVRLITGGGENV